MTLKDLLNFCENHPSLKGKESELQLTVRKHDKNQLTCYTTVPIDRIETGFDWTNNQIILHPSIKLSTEQSVVDDNTRSYVRSVTERNTKYLRLAAKIAALATKIEDKELKHQIQEVLGEFSGNSYN